MTDLPKRIDNFDELEFDAADQCGNYTKLFETLNRQYADSWAKDAAFWFDKGLYLVALKAIDPKPGETHVDVGSGTGVLVSILKELNPDSVVYGIDENEQLLMDAFQAMEAHRVPANIAGSKEIIFKPDGTVMHEPAFHKQMETLDLTARDKIHLICDDIRKCKVIDRILGDRKIDSGSLLMPGCSLSQCFQEPFKFGMAEDAELRQRAVFIADIIRKKTFEFMARKLKENGRLVVGDRMMLPEGHEMAFINASIRTKLASLCEYFEFDHVSLLKADFVDGKHLKIDTAEGRTIVSPDSTIKLITSMDQDGFKEMLGIDVKHTALVYKLNRNNVPLKGGFVSEEEKRRDRNRRKKQKRKK